MIVAYIYILQILQICLEADSQLTFAISPFLVHDDIASKTFAQTFMNDKHPCPHGIFQPVVFIISLDMGFQKSKISPFSKFIMFYHIWYYDIPSDLTMMIATIKS